jgi:hypothetical protein
MAAKVYFELEPSVGFNTVTHKVLEDSYSRPQRSLASNNPQAYHPTSNS